MDIETIREVCLKKSGVTEEFPFDESTLVFKVGSRMFLLAGLDTIPLRITLKCDPEHALERRERFDAVTPGYHMNKKHWITVVIDESIPESVILSWIDESYERVRNGLPAKVKNQLDS
jgi:predicted DNA-binding protein (MmcQ/YjbR family)